jgi:protease-4
VIDGVVKDTFQWFVGIVSERRKLPWSETMPLADGRIYTGQQALAVKLIDELGGEDVAVAWLGSKGVDTKLPVRDWEPKRPGNGLFSLSGAAIVWIAQQTGLAPSFAPAIIDRVLPESLKLDGLLSVWQGSERGDT